MLTDTKIYSASTWPNQPPQHLHRILFPSILVNPPAHPDYRFIGYNALGQPFCWTEKKAQSLSTDLLKDRYEIIKAELMAEKRKSKKERSEFMLSVYTLQMNSINRALGRETRAILS